MKHFAKIAQGDFSDVLAALRALPDPFASGEWRSKLPYSPHGDSASVELIGPPSHSPRDIVDSCDTVETGFAKIPAFAGAIRFIAEAAALRGTAGPARAMIVALRPGGTVKAHTDSGPYASATERYHLVLQTNTASLMVAGDESAFFRAGEVWWLDKHVRHAAANLGMLPRIHMIVDCWRAA